MSLFEPSKTLPAQSSYDANHNLECATNIWIADSNEPQTVSAGRW